MRIFQSYSTLKNIIRNYLISSRNTVAEKKFIKLLGRYKIRWSPFNRKVVLAAIVEDFAMCMKIAPVAYSLAKRHQANIGLYSVATQVENKVYKNKRLWDTIYSEIFYRKLDNVFLSFGGKLLYRNVYNRKSDDTEALFIEIKGAIKSKEDILSIKIGGLYIGDLINDTYLRMANKPYVDITDPFLYHLILQAIYIYDGFKRLFEKYEILAIVNSYTAYIHFGINVRMALQRGVEVYTVGSYNNLVHKVQPTYASHHNNHFAFKLLFDKLTDKHEKLSITKAIFEKRFTGEIDPATSYMKESAFNNEFNIAIPEIDWDKTVIVLAHCFFDSPHIYRDLLFVDFYDWIIFTLDRLSIIQDLRVVVKPHPNGVKGNEEMFEELKEKYLNTNILFIDKSTSNLQLFEARPKAIITAYGTAASEFAYHDIPVLCIYDNPFTAFNFAKVAYSKDEYAGLLLNIKTLFVNIDRQEILVYYYMQHIYYNAGMDADWLRFSKYGGETYCDSFLEDYMPTIDESYFNKLENVFEKGLIIAEKDYEDVLKMRN
jgi:hypothetical protein